MAVNAFISPPTASISAEMSSAVRRLGALEEQVLQIVRGARVGVVLVPGADAHPDAEGDRADRGQELGNYPQSARKDGAIDTARWFGGH